MMKIYAPAPRQNEAEEDVIVSPKQKPCPKIGIRGVLQMIFSDFRETQEITFPF